jgi:hypothetical protein
MHSGLSLFAFDADVASALLVESSLERFTLTVSAEKAAAATPQGLLLWLPLHYVW